MSPNTKTANRSYFLGLLGFTIFAILGIIKKGTTVGFILIAVAVVILICIPVVIALLRRLSSTVENAATHRPDAQIIPAYATGESRSLAAALGDPGKGWRSQGGNPLAIAVSADRVEIWIRKETTPRVSLATNRFTYVGVVQGQYGNRNVDTVAIFTEAGTDQDGEIYVGGVLFVPAYRPLRNMGGSDAAGITRAFEVLASVGIFPTNESA